MSNFGPWAGFRAGEGAGEGGRVSSISSLQGAGTEVGTVWAGGRRATLWSRLRMRVQNCRWLLMALSSGTEVRICSLVRWRWCRRESRSVHTEQPPATSRAKTPTNTIYKLNPLPPGFEIAPEQWQRERLIQQKELHYFYICFYRLMIYILTLAMGTLTWLLKAHTLVSRVSFRTVTRVASIWTAAWHPLRARVGIANIQHRLKYKTCN